MSALETRDRRAPRARVAHPEEAVSILVALGGTIGAGAIIWMAPSYQPASGIAWALPGWIAIAYLFFQILFLLVSVSQIRALGVIDSIVAILPLVAGLVLVAEWVLGRLPLSLFQINALALTIATGLAEFLLTIWIRFVVNRRTIAIDGG